MSGLGDQLEALLDITLVYPGHSSPQLFDFLIGDVSKIVVRVKILKLGYNGTPSLELIRSKSGSTEVRKFLNELWREKDLLINKIHNETNKIKNY